MSKLSTFSAETYLSRHLNTVIESPDAYGQLVAQESLWNAGNITILEQDNVTFVEVVRGSSRIKYAYSPVASDSDAANITEEYIKDEPWLFRELISAEIVNSKNGQRLDLIDELPERWKVFVDFGDESVDFCNILDKVIILTPRFANKFHYMTLAHEVGHAIDFTLHPHLYEIDHENESIKDAYQLESERNANAFALFKMRRFLSAVPEEPYNVNEFRGNLNLAFQTYVNNIIDERQERQDAKSSAVPAIGKSAIGYLISAQPVENMNQLLLNI